MDVLRTPDERFAGPSQLPYAPHYVESLRGYEGLRLHYLDEGPLDEGRLDETRADEGRVDRGRRIGEGRSDVAPRAAATAGSRDTYLCLHGEPTWSYLYRKMIPVFRASGARVVAPDLFGFGRSDKPVDDPVYTFGFHRDALIRLIESLDLRNVTLVCQDWGGILGLTLPMEMPDRFARLLVMNTGLPIGEPISPGFAAWKAYAASDPDLPVAGLIALSSPGALAPPDLSAYAAPFPDRRYKAGVRRFPQIVPVEAGMEGADLCRAARAYLRDEWRGPVRMAVGLRDPVLGAPVMDELRKHLRGCPEPLLVEEAGHFVQEWGEGIARWAVEEFAAAAQASG